MNPFLLSIFFFVLGTLTGSFADVVANRSAQGKGFLRGRSRCDNCQHVLTWEELIPILSFARQKGRCQNCRAKLSLEYPLVEVSTGALFVLTYQQVGALALGSITDIGELTLQLVIVSALIALFIADLKYYLLPDKILLPMIALVLVVGAIKTIRGTENIGILQGEITAALGASVFFLGLVLITKGRGMGGGDVKLAFLMGLLLGWPLTVIALYLSFLSGALAALLLIALGKRRFGQTIPFGPFMIGSIWVCLFWTEKVLQIAQRFLPIL